MNRIFLHMMAVLMGYSLFFGGLAQATSVKPVNLDELTTLAETVVKAELVDSQVVLDKEESGKMVRYYTWKVLDVIKGQADSELVFKQLADGEYRADSGLVVRQRLFFPTYQKGKTYVLFLPEAHPDTGLLAPIALWLGVYEVQKDADGNENVPQLKARAKMLRQDMPSGRFLGLQKSQIEQSSDYKSFKALVQEAMDL